MSWWTYIKGVIEVNVPGRTQAECRYILDTVLDHLPRVTGSEGDMKVYIAQEAGYNCSSSLDEFWMRTNNLKDYHGDKSRDRGFLDLQSNYMLTLDADLRDRMFDVTKREFMKWLCRLSKRLIVNSVVVKIDGDSGSMVISDNDPFFWMYEVDNSNDIAWTDYLMWDADPQSMLPLKLAWKYGVNKNAVEEMERRMKWEEERANESSDLP